MERKLISITNAELNTQLYRKMFAEQESYDKVLPGDVGGGNLEDIFAVLNISRPESFLDNILHEECLHKSKHRLCTPTKAACQGKPLKPRFQNEKRSKHNAQPRCKNPDMAEQNRGSKS